MLSLMLLVTIAAGSQAGAVSSGPPTIKDVAWIAGCWDSTRNGRHVAEHWMPPEGGTMMGVSRTTSGDKTTEWEFLIIRQGAQGLDYVAKPSRQPEATFTAARASATEVVFENPAHDFPKRIIYKRDGDSLTASIEGTMNGQNRRIDFPFKKASCGGS
jgi:Domain of unknown function (DUF6265)